MEKIQDAVPLFDGQTFGRGCLIRFQTSIKLEAPGFVKLLGLRFGD